MGSVISFIKQSFPPKPTWSANDIPDLTGQVIIVTGGNTGIGFETAKALLLHNAKVYIGARSQSKAEDAIMSLKKLTGKEAFFLKLDLADLKTVKAAAKEFLSKEKQLHVLYNNAGILIAPIDKLSVDGYDLVFGTNVIGPFYFTKLLLPALLTTAATCPNRHVRVVTTSSSAHMFAHLDFDTFKNGPVRRESSPGFLYCQSKIGSIIIATELAKRYGDQGIVSTSLHPGNILTNMHKNLSGITKAVFARVSYDAEHGALTQLWAGTSPEANHLNGKYFIPFARIGSTSYEAQNPQVGQKLWIWLEEQVQDL